MTSQTDTVTLADFLLARIAEDEAVGRACEPERERHPYGDRTLPSTPFAQLGDDLRGYLGGPLGDHAAHWHPARVLAECEAKRRMIDWAFANAEQIDGEWGDGCMEADMRAGRCDDHGARAAEAVLSKLALPYADHPDYREAWRP